jgi:hypothetical protein
MRSKFVRTCDFFCDVCAILFAITAFAPGALLDLIIPFPENKIRDYFVLGLGMLILAPINIALYTFEKLFLILADLGRIDHE